MADVCLQGSGWPALRQNLSEHDDGILEGDTGRVDIETLINTPREQGSSEAEILFDVVCAMTSKAWLQCRDERKVCASRSTLTLELHAALYAPKALEADVVRNHGAHSLVWERKYPLE